jgi:hypothetical protein
LYVHAKLFVLTQLQREFPRKLYYHINEDERTPLAVKGPDNDLGPVMCVTRMKHMVGAGAAGTIPIL